jgi:hypothetical protein
MLQHEISATASPSPHIIDIHIETPNHGKIKLLVWILRRDATRRCLPIVFIFCPDLIRTWGGIAKNNTLNLGTINLSEFSDCMVYSREWKKYLRYPESSGLLVDL